MSNLKTILGNHAYHVLTNLDLDIDFEHIYATDLLSTAINQVKAKTILITLIASQTTINLGIMLDIEIIILNKLAKIDPELIEKANEAGITLIQSDYLTHEIIVDFVKRGLI